MESHDWADSYARAGVQVRSCEDGTVEFHYTSRGGTLDLSDVPDGTYLRITTAGTGGTQEVKLKNARQEHHVAITQPISVRVIDDHALGTIQFRLNGDGRHQTAHFSGAVSNLHVSRGTAKILDGLVTTVVLQDGAIEGDTEGVENVVAQGKVTFPDGARCLETHPLGATILLKSRHTLESLHIHPSARAGAGIILASDGDKSTTLHVESISTESRADITLENANITGLAQTMGAIAVNGHGKLHLVAGHTFTDLSLGESIGLNAPAAALLRFGGHLRAQNCRDTTIHSVPARGYEYVGAGESGQNALTNATLRGVFVTDNAAGRRRLHELREAAVVEPHLSDLRVRNKKWRVPFARTRLKNYDQSSRELDDASFFAQELAGLVNEKCGSGSVRTKANWAAHRGRHLNASSHWEAFALGLFRLVGYGQRPGPPALLWLALALLFSLPMTSLTAWPPAEFSTVGHAMSVLGRHFLALLLSPLFLLLRLAGDPEASNLAQPTMLAIMLMRTLVTVPFAFSLLAIGRFLRADWPW